jgi:hypothetical protein
MHTLSASFVLGYHGCDQSVAKQLLDGDNFRPSNNEYDWLGPGIYFWEANPQRGLDFARELAEYKRGKGKVIRPAVVGAVIDLGLCLDLTTTAGLKQVRTTHMRLPAIFRAAGRPIPQNNKDGLRRNLDCTVITMLHEVRRNADEPTVDSVKGIFVEGNPIYPNSGFHEKTHIQICVCNPDRIKGVFRVHQRFLS